MKHAQQKQATQRTIHVAAKDGKFKVYDEQSRFRAAFDDKATADAYVVRLKTPNHPFVMETMETVEAML